MQKLSRSIASLGFSLAAAAIFAATSQIAGISPGLFPFH
jgi:hypothetical protein